VSAPSIPSAPADLELIAQLKSKLRYAELRIRVLEERLRLMRIEKYSAGGEKLSQAQMQLFDLEPVVSVVGMHRALPNSLACGHSMNGDPSTSDADNLKSLQSGRRAYEDLWEFRNSTQKHVYVLASHSHFYMQDIFDIAYWQHHAETSSNIPNNAKQDKLSN
jgi:hypothetical protein